MIRHAERVPRSRMGVGGNTTATGATHPHSLHCPHCFWVTGHRTHEEAEKVYLSHPCKGRKVAQDQSFTVPKGRSIIQFIEERIDQEYAAVLALPDTTPEAQQAEAIGRLQGMCHALAIILNPHSPDPLAVAAAAESRAGGEA